MSRILVTGSHGFLGQHLVRRLAKEGHEVLACDSLIGSEQENLYNVDGVTSLIEDAANLSSWSGHLVMRGLEIAYLLAATPHEGLSVFSPATVCRNTYMSTIGAAVAAINSGCKRIVFASSMARYGEQGDLPYREDRHAPRPVDPYGIAKVACEETLLSLGKAHDVEVVIVVPHNIYGPGQRYWDPFRNVVGIMMNLMLQGRQPIIYGDGEQRRCFSYIDDCVDPLFKAGFTPGIDCEVINIGPDDEFISINDLARQVATSIGFSPLDPQYVPGRPMEVRLAHCSANKARRLLGYEPSTCLWDGVRRMLEWMREAGPRQFQYHLPVEILGDNCPVTWKERLF